MTGKSTRQDTLPDSQFLNSEKKQSIKAYQRLDAGVTIRTKEGDLVTLTSNSFSQLDAFMYNSKGVMETQSKKSVTTQHQRKITLTSGDNFSFSVTGNLSEKELGDIDNIIKGIDGIISEMAQGDMNDAVKKALSMGGYDTVSMYSADISYQRSYVIASDVQAKAIKTTPEIGRLPREKNNVRPSLKKLLQPNHSSRTEKNNTINNMDKFIEKMTRELEKPDRKLLDKAQKTIDKLFRYHLEDVKKNTGNEISPYKAIENTRKKIRDLIDEMTGKIFKNYFAAFLE